MAVSRVEEFAAYQFADEFKEEVYRLIRESPGAFRDFKFRGQLEEAVSGIQGTMAEGFGRRWPKEFALYLRYSLGSIRESQTRLRDGIQRGYFQEPDCAAAFAWASRCHRATTALWRSQEKRARDEKQNRSGGRPSLNAKRPRKRRG